MASLIAVASGNLTSSSSWATVDSTSLLDSEAGNTTLTTSYVTSSTFTPGAITIDGIAVKVASRVGSPTGTITVALDLATVDVTGTAVTINVSDIDSCSTTANEGGWYLFKFSAPVLLLAATAYGVKAKTSSSTQVNLYRNATAGNWARMLRTTTTAAPGVGDIMHVLSERTGAGTSNSLTVTMDNTATTDFGSGTDSTAALTIGKGGTLTFGTSTSTAYYLKLSGDLIVYSSGTFNVGTVGTPIPRISTAVLEFDPVADGGMGLNVRNISTVSLEGLSRTSAKNFSWCLLNSDVAANATTLNVDTNTGWLDNDVIAVSSTTRTATQAEQGTLNGNAGSSSLTVDGFTGTAGGVLNAHGGGGTTDVVAEVVLLTRNVIVRSATSTIMSYVGVSATAIFDSQWVEFYYVGANSNGKGGVETATTTGTFNMQYCSIHDCEVGGLTVTATSSVGVTVSNVVLYNINTNNTASTLGVSFIASSPSSMDSCVIISAKAGSNTGAVSIGNTGVFTNNRISSCTITTSVFPTLQINPGTVYQTISGNIVHSNNGRGVCLSGFSSFNGGTISSMKVWRNSSLGVTGGINNSQVLAGKIVLDSWRIFGNATSNISFTDANELYPTILVLKSCQIDGDASFSTANGINRNAGTPYGYPVYLINCLFGTVTTHSTADILVSVNSIAQIYAFNTNFASATPISGLINSNLHSGFLRSQKDGQSSTTFKSTFKDGVILNNTTTRHTASGYSWKMTPTNASYKLILPGPTDYDTFKVAVNANSAVTITGYVQKDGSYNGNAPRLVLVGSLIAGIASDVTYSMTVASGNWEQFSVTATPTEAGVLEFYFDCDGTAGNVYVDDISVSQ